MFGVRPVFGQQVGKLKIWERFGVGWVEVVPLDDGDFRLSLYWEGRSGLPCHAESMPEVAREELRTLRDAIDELLDD